MIKRIIEHNRLNGVVFALIEFLVIAGAAAFIGVAYGRHGNGIGVLAAAGTVLNCLLVATFATVDLARGERGASLLKMLDREYRAQVARRHPGLMTDTMIIAVTALIPYLLAATVGADAIRIRRIERP